LASQLALYTMGAVELFVFQLSLKYVCFMEFCLRPLYPSLVVLTFCTLWGAHMWKLFVIRCTSTHWNEIQHLVS